MLLSRRLLSRKLSNRKYLMVKSLVLVGLLGDLVAVSPVLYAQERPEARSKCPDGSAPLQFLNFHFSGDSYRPGSNCGATSCPDRLVMAGSGAIYGNFCVGQTVTNGKVTASGSFAHYEITLPNTPGNDIPLKFTGTWKATGLVSFHLLGLLGTDSLGSFPLAAGQLVLNIMLVRPSTPAIPLTQVPSLLTLVSDLQTWPGVSVPAAPGVNSMPDGVSLIAPNPGGYSFIPIPVQSVPLAGGAGTMEAHTSVVFSTLDELRVEPPASTP
jgi:hypothetical protein